MCVVDGIENGGARHCPGGTPAAPSGRSHASRYAFSGAAAGSAYAACAPSAAPETLAIRGEIHITEDTLSFFFCFFFSHFIVVVVFVTVRDSRIFLFDLCWCVVTVSLSLL